MNQPPLRVLAVDPGRQKCGLAVVDRQLGLRERAVIARESLTPTLQDWCERHQPDLLILGWGTGARSLLDCLSEFSLPVRRVPEKDSTRLARVRYFVEHPPRGWRRFLPSSLQTPPVPVDDYAAWILAEQFLASFLDK